MTTATVIIPDSIKIKENEKLTIDAFLKALYSSHEDIEDYLDVKESLSSKNNKFYNFDDIADEY